MDRRSALTGPWRTCCAVLLRHDVEVGRLRSHCWNFAITTAFTVALAFPPSICSINAIHAHPLNCYMINLIAPLALIPMTSYRKCIVPVLLPVQPSSMLSRDRRQTLTDDDETSASTEATLSCSALPIYDRQPLSPTYLPNFNPSGSDLSEFSTTSPRPHSACSCLGP